MKKIVENMLKVKTTDFLCNKVDVIRVLNGIKYH